MMSHVEILKPCGRLEVQHEVQIKEQTPHEEGDEEGGERTVKYYILTSVQRNASDQTALIVSTSLAYDNVRLSDYADQVKKVKPLFLPRRRALIGIQQKTLSA